MRCLFWKRLTSCGVIAMPDAYSQWQELEREQEQWLEKRPVCAYCDQPIQEDRAWLIADEFYHEECAAHEFKVWTEDYTT